ncbi:unnamed protein product, partial [Rotaria magnacalcarata]
DDQQKDVFGDRPCTTDPCRNRHSSNGVAFHGKNYQPQARWVAFNTRDPNAIYIDFHTTMPEAAVSIVLSEFIASKGGLLVRKDAHRDMNLRNFVQISAWHEDYDTCYMNHEQENKDEYCITNPVKQIISWVVVIDQLKDLKVVRYGLDTEVDSAKCYCI